MIIYPSRPCARDCYYYCADEFISRGFKTRLVRRTAKRFSRAFLIKFIRDRVVQVCKHRTRQFVFFFCSTTRTSKISEGGQGRCPHTAYPSQNFYQKFDNNQPLYDTQYFASDIGGLIFAVRTRRQKTDAYSVLNDERPFFNTHVLHKHDGRINDYTHTLFEKL